MTRRISFYGYHKNIPSVARQEENVTEHQLEFIREKVQKARADEATAFACEDYLHAIKVADNLRKSLGLGYVVVARRDVIFIKAKNNETAVL